MIFLIVRTLVLRRKNSTMIAFWVLPVLILITFWINLFFILTRVSRAAKDAVVTDGRRVQTCLDSAAAADKQSLLLEYPDINLQQCIHCRHAAVLQ